MGRYSSIDLVDFTNFNGDIIQLKDMRIIPDYKTLVNHQYLQKEFFDEIIIRKEYYGDGNENLSYSIIEANKETIVENNFDMSNIKNIIIPVVE
jgi:hypothetical protein